MEKTAHLRSLLCQAGTSKLQTSSQTVEHGKPVDLKENAGKTLFFPLSIVETSMRQHPVFEFFRPDLLETHKCMTELLMTMQSKKVTKSEAMRSPPVNMTKYDRRCQECGEVCILDAIRGHTLCSSCGLVNDSNLSFHASYEKQVETSTRNSKEHASSFYQSSASDCPKHWNEVKEWIDHFDPYIHMSEDMNIAAKRLGRMIETLSSSLSKAFAAVCVVQLQGKIDLEAIQDAVKRSSPLPQLAIMPERSPPKYACQKCGESVDELYMVRRHPCKWFSRKRQRANR